MNIKRYLQNNSWTALYDIKSEIMRGNEDIKITTNIIIDSSVPNAIIDYAKKMGIDSYHCWHSRYDRFGKVFTGSVASKVIIHAHCPVL